MVKLTDRCFCCFTAAMLVPLGRAPTWRFHTMLYKFGWSTFPNNARMENRTELNLGKVFYVWLIYHFQDFWLNLLNGYDIYFWLRDTANQPYIFHIIHPQKQKRSVQPFCFWEHSRSLVTRQTLNAISAADIAFIMSSSQAIVNRLNTLDKSDFS